jgi:sphingolipid 4-desaturase/C4-monooxygenase
MNQSFVISNEAEPHVARTREIIAKHPEIKNLMGRNPMTFLYILGVVGLQITLAIVMSNFHWAWSILVAFCIGAFANHALFTLIHECAHNLVFKSRLLNILTGIFCDLPHAFPSSVQFRKYHLKHHAFQGHYEIDADIPSDWEAKLIGNSFLGKAIWLMFFPLFQMTRPPRLKQIQFNSPWVWVDAGVVIAFDIFMFVTFGWVSVFYMIVSFFFSVGLHPLGGRWIQEHFLVSGEQETFSYYGPLNKVAFNVGYHNEHHDFSYIPWNKLPEIKRLAPEYYDSLVSHQSWSKLVWRFLTDKNLSLFSRTVRENTAGVEVTRATEVDYKEQIKMKEAIA